MSLHLRYTPYELPTEPLQPFLEKYDKYIIARERFTKTGTQCPVHYHCYIESDLDLDTVRTAFKKYLCIPTGAKGRNNKYYMLKKWNDDYTYICKQGDIIACKGYDLSTLRVPPVPVKNREKEYKNSEEAPPSEPKKTKDEKKGMWQLIWEEALFWTLSNKKKIEVEDALRIITLIYIKKLLPLPHPGDRKRWAQSLVMYSNLNLLTGDSPENLEEVIKENTAIFMADHFVQTK